MAAFAKELKHTGHVVQYLTLDDTLEFSDLPSLLQAKIAEFDINSFEYQLPDEYRLRSQLSDFTDALNINSNVYETEHFYITDKSLKTHFKKGKSHRLESFYRKMRKQFNLLMDDDEPLGGQWNFDASNRHKLNCLRILR
jgi:deoxyribodipyrimidine photolyase-related protein